jgi:IS1 family transposase/transposase-like protein
MLQYQLQSGICYTCENKLIKKDKQTKTKMQKLYCKHCNKFSHAHYHNFGGLPFTAMNIVHLVKEGVGIRSISRLLHISTSTVIKKIIAVAAAIKPPPISKSVTEFEVDEMNTFIKRKSNPIWIVMALGKESRNVVSMAVGSRNKQTLKQVINTLLLQPLAKIYTDNLPLYKTIIPAQNHVKKHFGTNHIERKNLSLRTHLKRLNRRSICFSKSFVMLKSCLKIYLWNTFLCH